MDETTFNREQNRLVVASLMILALAAIAAMLIFTRSVMIPFVLAIFAAIVVSPVQDFLVLKCKCPRWLGALAALLVVFGGLFILGIPVMAAVNTAVMQISDYSENSAWLLDRLDTRMEQWGLDQLDTDVIGREFQAQLPSIATHTLGTATGLVSNVFLILIFLVFLLSGRDSHNTSKGLYAEFESTTRRYLATKLVISLVTGILVWAILAALGMQMAIVFGALAFLLNFIPSIGSVIATFLPLPIAVSQFYDPETQLYNYWMIAAVVVLPGAVQVIIGNVIEPKLIGRGMALHPVAVLLALSFWGLLWGVMGMVLAVPITATIRSVLIRFDTTRYLGDIMAGELPSG
ncbi:MAG: AI-2E family transporter [Pirellulales bacterium]|nr:AI-2E family transporter [Pirellulales bacterium]